MMVSAVFTFTAMLLLFLIQSRLVLWARICKVCCDWCETMKAFDGCLGYSALQKARTLIHSLWRAQPLQLLETHLFHLTMRTAWQWQRSHCIRVSLSNQQRPLQYSEVPASPHLLSPPGWNSHLSSLLLQSLGPYPVKGWTLLIASDFTQQLPGLLIPFQHHLLFFHEP